MGNLEVQKQKNKGLSTELADDWGTEDVSGSDIRIHKILLMQGLSEFVADEKASMGDFVDSVTAEKLGDSRSPISIIPIYMWKDFVIMEEIDGKFEFKERVPFTPETAHWREFENREYEEGGVKMRRDFCMNFLVMLENDLHTEGSIPKVMTFRRTGANAGKDIAEYFLKAKQKGKPACFFTLDIGAKMTKNEKGNFYVPVIAKARETQDFGRVEPILKNWYLTFKSGAAKLDESDLQSENVEAGGSDQGKFEGQF